MVPLISLRSIISLRIFSVDPMCVNKREVSVLWFFLSHSMLNIFFTSFNTIFNFTYNMFGIIMIRIQIFCVFGFFYLSFVWRINISLKCYQSNFIWWLQKNFCSPFTWYLFSVVFFYSEYKARLKVKIKHFFCLLRILLLNLFLN